MLSGTHIKIANYVYSIFKKQYGVCLNRKNLIYGSIKPDFTQNKIPHYIDKSIDYIEREIEELVKTFNTTTKKDFSRRLGIIIHYISDYFCRAHNTEYYRRNIVAHLKYEKRLAKIMKDIKFVKTINYEKYLGSIKNYIIELNKEYMKKRSMEQDREYTISAIHYVCNYIAERIEENRRIKVA